MNFVRCGLHPGYKAVHERRRALFRPATHAVYREILGVRAMVKLIPLLNPIRQPTTPQASPELPQA